ncbi:transposable element Tcb2 transposase [Trichonephila clavipes]|nr:transposable element Tcb2 transposase [Trichonephila clavipes]
MLCEADAARLLNVSRSVVHSLWNQYQTEASVSRRHFPGRPRATTPAGIRFIALSARRRRISVLQTTLYHQGEEYPLVRCEGAFTIQVYMQGDQLYESRFTLESDSGRLLIWRERSARYYQSNTVERHSYRGGWNNGLAGISLGIHTNLHVLQGGTLTGVRYRDEILDPYAGAIGNDFILMDDNARTHRAVIFKEYLEGLGLERMEWSARSPDLNPIENLWDYLGRQVAALSPPPRTLSLLSLLRVWSSVISITDNLIDSMEIRCRQCIQARGGHIPY